MKKLMAIILLGAASLSTNAFGWWGMGNGCCGCQETYSTSYDCGCPAVEECC